MKNLLVSLGLAILLFSCETNKKKVDLVVYNANVYTVNEDFEKAQAFAIKEGKFIAVGSSNEIRAAYDAVQLVDAEGQTVTPGLIDAHCHFYGLGLNQQVADLRDTKSFEEVLERVSEFQDVKPNSVVRGRGWDQNDWEEKKFPTKKELDALFPKIPVVLERVDGHAYLVNQVALDMAGIDLNTKVIGGEIVKKNNQITGVLVDNPMGLIDAVMPPPNVKTKVQALKDAEDICFKYGLTTVNDAGLDRSTIELIDSLQQAGELSIRVYAMISNAEKDIDYYLEKGPYKTALLNVRSVKVYGDGALGSRGAALKAPYSDKQHHFGAMITAVDDIKKLAEKLAASDYQMNTHAIGDSANAVVLRTYKEVLKNKPNRRWKVEHAQVIEENDFHFFEDGIIPSVQPTHATSDMYWAEDRLGATRVQGAYAFKKLLNKAGMIALGTDFPVEKVSPFLTFYAAVARKDTDDYPKDGFQMQDALTREEALKGMTIWAAYSNFEEDEKGSIEVGKFADFAVYNSDLMQVPLAEIPNIEVTQTYIGGALVN